MVNNETKGKENSFTSYLSPMGAWALAFGGAVGWGAFVMPGTTFLPLAGPVGTAVGILIGAIVMLLIGVNYHYLMIRSPDDGGAFTYTKKSFGYDHGFLCAWFLILTYVAIIWANATALPLIGRKLIGDTFQWGFHYELAGFQIYMGEVLLALASLLLAGLLCMRGSSAARVQVLMALILCCGILIAFGSVFFGNEDAFVHVRASGGRNNGLAGVFNIVALAPWAYVGFESISHSAGEFRFSTKHSFGIMVAALAAAAVSYGLLALLAGMVHPPQCQGWWDYVANLDGYDGIKSMPTFYAVYTVLGKAGMVLMGVTALGGIVTGLVSNYVASSRLICSMARDRLLPEFLGRLNRYGVPENALMALMAGSVVIPFFGRTAISWIVDVTTVGAAIAYAYTSACAYKSAKAEGDRFHTLFGAVGLGLSLMFILYFLVPNMLAVSTLSPESYLILATWSILGFLFFRQIFRRDEVRRLGRSTVVWMVLFGLILFTSLIWVRQSINRVTTHVTQEIHTYAADEMRKMEKVDVWNPSEEEAFTQEREALIDEEMERVIRSVKLDSSVQMALIVVALVLLFDIYSVMQKREKQMEVDKILAEESSRAKTSFLSNMSHEIRTPMNAIIGLDNIALKDPDLSPRTREHLEKIGASATHLLGLINDILDMRRIESGSMVLKSEEFSFRDFLDQINVIINGQCQDKGLTFKCRIIGRTADYYVGDDMKLKQVLINILGNSVKFTNAPGTVTFTAQEVNHFEGHRTLRFTMSDTGIGMDKEYIPKIFEAFSQEDATTTNRYGGSGLGMAITKNIVEMMNGEIAVESEKGVGSTFTVTVTLKSSSSSAHASEAAVDLSHLRTLVVDDDEVACEHAKLVLSDIGISAEQCSNSREALQKMLSEREQGRPYKLLVTDYKMPGMDGIELTRALRQQDKGETVVLLLTGYSLDDATNEAWKAGADGILNKPLFTDTLTREIQNALHKRAPLEEDVPMLQPQEDKESYSSLAGRRILLAEDIDINADILIDLLSMEEMEGDHAVNGQVVVDMFAKSKPGYYDAILMDVRMPVMDGLTACRIIREMDHPDAKSIPIIAMTANAFDEDVQRSLQAGMNAHLSKPVEPERLYETLNKLIHQREEAGRRRGV